MGEGGDDVGFVDVVCDGEVEPAENSCDGARGAESVEFEPGNVA